MSYVLDSSAVLALLKEEPGGDHVSGVLKQSVISTVNLSEAVEVMLRVAPEQVAMAVFGSLALTTIPVNDADAIEAARIGRPGRRFGLSLGDRFCLALGRRLGATVLTADRAWAEAAPAIGVAVTLIR